VIYGEVIIEQFGYRVERVDLPLVDARTGLPTGEGAHCTDVCIIPFGKDQEPIGSTIRLRLTDDEQVDEFQRHIARSKIVTSSVMPPTDARVLQPGG
jgi:hypothetical protein